MMGTFLKAAAAIVAVILVWFLSGIIPVSGIFQTLEPKLVASCTPLEVFPGTEDVAIDHATNLAFVSATARRDADRNDYGPLTGGIFVIQLDDPVSATRVSPVEMTDFQPHGISLWRGDAGEARLFVINHLSSGEDTVELFDIGEGGALTHVESVSFEAMYSPNDLVAVGPRQFYATNDRGYRGGLVSTLEQYFALPLSSAVYYDGAKGDYIKKGLVYSNGINRSLDGNTIYIAELLKRRISIFDRDEVTGALTKSSIINLNTAPDNIDVDQDGALWIAGHSKVFDFVAHADDVNNIAPSHVVKVDAKSGSVEDVFISIKGEINAASVGAVHNKTLIVGAVFDPHVMVCPLP